MSTSHVIILTGNVGAEPEMRYTANGVPVVRVRLATSVGYGENRKTAWWSVTAWRSRAEFIAEHVHKGYTLWVLGKMEPDENGGPRIWTGKDGTAHADYEITADEVEIVDRRAGATGESHATSTTTEPAGDTLYPKDDEIPF